MLKPTGCYAGTENQVELEGHDVVVVDMTSACHRPLAASSDTLRMEVVRHKRQKRRETILDETRLGNTWKAPNRDNVCRMEHTAS